MIGKIEHGDPARLFYYQTYAAALGMRLGLVPDKGNGPEGEGSVDALVTTLAARVLSVILEVDRHREEDVVDRRQLIVSLAALLLDSALPRNLRQLFTERTLPIKRADDIEAMALDCARYLVDRCAAAGGGAVCDVAVAMGQQATSWLESGSHQPTVQRALQRLQCELWAWAGWLTLDAGRPELAERYLHQTLLSARLSENADVEAYALDSLSILLAQRGQLSQARQAALLGMQVATSRTDTPKVQALFHFRAAKFAAELGDDGSFAKEVTAARDALERSEGTSSPLWLDFLTTGEYDLGDGHLALGQAEEAAAAFRSVASDPESNQHRDVVQATVREAQALAMMGDTSHAGERGLAALGPATTLSSELILRDLRALRTTLVRQAPAPANARQFVAAYDELVAPRT